MKQDGKQGLHSHPGRQKKRGGAGSRNFFTRSLAGITADLLQTQHSIFSTLEGGIYFSR